MRKPRKLSTLLRVVFDRPSFFRVGLCGWVEFCFRHKCISSTERDLLYEYIESNKPDNEYAKNPLHLFYWHPGLIEPRLDWLEEHIAKLRKKGL